jgi:hypothetical protein
MLGCAPLHLVARPRRMGVAVGGGGKRWRGLEDGEMICLGV